MTQAALPLLFLLGSSGASQDKDRDELAVLKAEDQPRRMLYNYYLGECAKLFNARRKALSLVKTPEDVRKRQEEIRVMFLKALGGLPARTPLNPRVTASEPRDGYRIEKVIYESRPEHHLTAILYLPFGSGPFPGVLVPCGHFDQGKAAESYQRACILLARNGIAALCFDPFGQGERVQLLTPEGKPAAGYGTSEHTHAAAGALLVGSCVAQYHIWDGIRSLDYLSSRPEIDPARLGCMGNSGGGTQTAYLMALDGRIACAVPNCYITSLERLFATIGPQDGEQNIPGQVAFGMEHADYILLRAPRPTQISCTTRDFFDIQGAWTTYREAKRIYGILGHSERADIFEWDAPHSLSRPTREAAVGWFRRWLLSSTAGAPPEEAPCPVAKDADLHCTSSGSVIREFKEKTVFDFTATRARELAVRRGALHKEELVRRIRELIGLEKVGAAQVLSRSEPMRRGGLEVRRVAFETEPGIKVPALGIAPAEDPDRPPAVLYAGSTKNSALKAGSALAIDLRGLGETLPAGKRGDWERSFGSEWKEAFLGFHIQRPLLGRRVHDFLAVLETLRGPTPLVLGEGPAAPIVLHAAALEPRIAGVIIEGGVISWSAVAETPITVNQLPNVVPGALEVYDFDDLAALVAPRPLTIRNPVDPQGKPVSQAALEAAYRKARAAYEAAGAADKLVLQAAP